MDEKEAPWVDIHVIGRAGYVWDAAVFKQQNAIHGLPLQLSEEEVTLVLEKGWARLQPALGVPARAAVTAVRKRRRPAWEETLEEDEEPSGGSGDEAGPGGEDPPAWKAALADGSAFEVPTVPAQAPVSAAADAADGGDCAAAAPAWEFPATEEERHRYWVFRDLHQRGYRLTGGSKFGADYLAYPGDSTQYHAQLCVRVVPYDSPLLPAALSAACRGSHQARKHLLLASVEEGPAALAVGEAAAAAGAGRMGGGPEPRVRYTTFGPVEGFG